MSVEQRSHVRTPGSSKTTPPQGLTPEQAALLEERRRHAWTAQHAYFERAAILGKLNYWIGVPVVIVTTLTGSEIVASRTSANPIPVWVGLITVSAAVLASLQTFFRFGERAAFSAVAASRYAKLRRRIEDCLVAPPESQAERLQEIQKLEDDVGEQSPPIGERRWVRWQVFSEQPTPPTRRERWSAMVRPQRVAPSAGRPAHSASTRGA